MSDPNYNNVSLLLHMDGANGSTTFTDNSPSPKTVTANGNAQVSTTQSKFGGASGYFDGSGDYLSIPNSSDFDFGSGNFTIEFWVYIPTGATNDRGILAKGPWPSSSDNSFLFYYGGSGELSFYFSSGSGWAGSSNFINNAPTNTWLFLTVSRDGNNIRLFYNGTLANTIVSSSALATNANSVTIGSGSSGNGSFNGYIDEIRITKGIARYTANFTAPTSAFPDAGFPEARLQTPGPLGPENLLSATRVDALFLDNGPLGQPSFLAQQSLIYAQAPSMLGDLQAVANQWVLLASAPTMLGDANPLAWHLFARADVPSMLGAVNPLAVHDFTGQLGDATTYYVMDLTTPSGIVRVPISSWQATLQTGLSNYVQCVVPAVQSYVTQINAATQFKILRRVTLPDGFVIEYQMASGPLQTVTLDQGPFRYTATIAGYSSGFAINETPSPAYNRTMQGLRSVSVSEGKARVRCSIDWLLRPSQRVFAGDRNFIASYINYYVGNNDAYMEVGER